MGKSKQSQTNPTTRNLRSGTKGQAYSQQSITGNSIAGNENMEDVSTEEMTLTKFSSAGRVIMAAANRPQLDLSELRTNLTPPESAHLDGKIAETADAQVKLINKQVLADTDEDYEMVDHNPTNPSSSNIPETSPQKRPMEKISYSTVPFSDIVPPQSGKQILIQQSQVTPIEHGEILASSQQQSVEELNILKLRPVLTVLNHSKSAHELVNSGYMEELNVIGQEALAKMGAYRLVTTRINTTIKPSMQIWLAVVGRVYKNLPDASYDETTMVLFHYTAMKALGPVPESDRYGNVVDKYEVAKRLKLAESFYELSQVFIPHMDVVDPNFTNLMSPSDFHEHLEELKKEYPEICIAYKMAVQFTLGGVECIQPIPNLAMTYTTLSTYINAICQGSGRLSLEDINLESRSIYHKTVKVTYENVAVLDSRKPEDFIPVAQNIPVSGIANVGVRTGKKQKNTREGQINTSSQLLSQAKTRAPPTGRDTTAFRESVTSVQIYIDRLTRVENENEELRNIVRDLVKKVEKLEKANENIEQSFANYIQRSSAADLNSRSNVNRTLLTIADTKMQEEMVKRPEVHDLDFSEKEKVLEKLINYHGQPFVDDLVKDVRGMFVKAGRMNEGANVCDQTIKNNMGRKRLIEMIRGMP